MVLRRFFLAILLVEMLGFTVGCTQFNSTPSESFQKLTIGVVAYGEGTQSVDRYQNFVNYLGQQTKTVVELEPAYNEVKAIEQIQRRAWDVVFAPPGLAAIAVSKAQYKPIFPLQGITNLSSVIIVRQDSPLSSLPALNNQVLALGQPGSATGYYVPLYNLYGILLAEVRIAPTPQTALQWVANKEVAAGAMAKDEFNQHRKEFLPTEFRILHSSQRIPSGSVLLSPDVEARQAELIQQALNQASPQLAQEVGYVPNTAAPDYKTLITFIDKVKPIESRIQEKPAPLYQADEEAIR